MGADGILYCVVDSDNMMTCLSYDYEEDTHFSVVVGLKEAPIPGLYTWQVAFLFYGDLIGAAMFFTARRLAHIKVGEV